MSQGLSLRVNPLFLLVMVVFSLAGLFTEAFIAFIIVLLHEFVHLLVAGRSGFFINRIELFPFGGVAEYRGLLEMEPWQEIKVALSGPLFNLAVALFLYYLIFLGIIPVTELLNLIIRYNLLLGFFNLIPALPLDGGRVLRAILVAQLGFRKGSRVAVFIAKIIAVTGGIVGVLSLIFYLSNLWFLLLAFFVYGAALREEKQIIYRLLSFLTHREEMMKNLKAKPVFALAVRGELPLKEVIYMINPVRYNLFFVLDYQLDLAGIVTESHLLNCFFNINDRDIKIRELL
jgi:stage IV sporulation protein FB